MSESDTPNAVSERAGSRLREGECAPNVPDVEPDVIAAPAPVPSETPAAPGEPEPAADAALPRWLRWGYPAVGLFMAAMFGLFLFGQAISSFALAAALPAWARYLLLTPLAFCGLAALGGAAGLAWSWIRLRRVRQVNLAALEELRKRAETRRDGLGRYQAARRELERYLERYPLAGREAGRLAKAGLPDADVEAMHREREFLRGREIDSGSWLDEFRDTFQARLDKAAARRVDSWSLKAAGCVMASPLPLLDAVLVLTIALRMIRDLCVLYNVRAGQTASVILLTRAVRNAFVAGVASDAAGAAGEMAGDEIAGLLGDTALGTAASGLARVLAPKLGEGAVNALFMRRLGRAAVRMLQPLAEKRDCHMR